MGSKRRVRRVQAAFACSQLCPHDSRVKRIKKTVKSVSFSQNEKHCNSQQKAPHCGAFCLS